MGRAKPLRKNAGPSKTKRRFEDGGKSK